jgi:pimeloyl-ACP methyl ester carboxylesterase
MSPIVTGAGVDLAYEEQGSGRPVVLVHGMASDHAALDPLARDLGRDARVIAYSRRGYGGSDAPEPYAGTTVMEQAEDLAAVLRGLRATGAVVAADGFGALAVLDVARRHPGLIAAAALHEPPLFAFAPDATRALSDERAAIEAAVFADGPQAGVAVWLGDRADTAGGARARATYPAFFADYAGLATWPVTRAELRAIELPVVIITGPATAPHVLAAADALHALLPASRRTDDGDLSAATRALLVD